MNREIAEIQFDSSNIVFNLFSFSHDYQTDKNYMFIMLLV